MLLTVNGLAEREGVTPTTIRNWVRSHALPACRIGRRIMINHDSFHEWLKAKEQVIEPPEKFIPPEPYVPRSKIAAKMKKIY